MNKLRYFVLCIVKKREDNIIPAIFATRYFAFFLIFSLILITESELSAQISGSIDKTFGDNGIRVTDISHNQDVATKVLICSNGKILSTGKASDGGYAIVKYNTNGKEDYTFAPFGYVTACEPTAKHCFSNDAVLQNDGKIVLAGNTYSDGVLNGRDIGMVRFNENGSVDSTFANKGFFLMPLSTLADYLNSIDIQRDKKLISTGTVRDYNTGLYNFVLLRLNSNGTPDNSFGTNGKIVARPNSNIIEGITVKVLYDQKILILSKCEKCGKGYTLLKYNTNGTLDTSFGTGGISYFNFNTSQYQYYSLYLTKMTVQTDGKILAHGHFSNNINYGYILFRFNEKGIPDSTFGINGIVVFNTNPLSIIASSDIMQQKDGKILALGSIDAEGTPTYNNSWLMMRFNSNGTIDSSFNSIGRVKTTIEANVDSWANSFALQNDDKIVATGDIYSSSGSISTYFATIRYNNIIHKLNIYVKTSPTDSFIIHPYITDTSLIMKNQIAASFGTDLSCFKIYYNNKELDDIKTLEQNQIQDSSTIVYEFLMPVPTIQQTGNILTSSSSTGNQWYNKAGLITGANKQSYTISESDTFWVRVTQGSCFAFSEKGYYSHTVGIEPSGDAVSLETYPNPSDGLIHISISNPKKVNYRISISDLNGKSIMEKNFVTYSNVESFDFTAPKGMYILSLIESKTLVKKKLVIQ